MSGSPTSTSPATSPMAPLIAMPPPPALPPPAPPVKEEYGDLEYSDDRKKRLVNCDPNNPTQEQKQRFADFVRVSRGYGSLEGVFSLVVVTSSFRRWTRRAWRACARSSRRSRSE